MMNPNQSEELREMKKILDKLKVETTYSDSDGWVTEASKQSAEQQLEALFQNRLKRAEVEARIDELKNRLKVQFIPSHWHRLCEETNSWAKYVDRRIAQLNQSLEEER